MSETTLSPDSLSKLLLSKRMSAKLAVLQSWVRDGVPWKTNDLSGQVCLDENDEKVLDYFPTNILEFAQWDGSQNCLSVREHLGTLHSCSRTTLGQLYHQALREDIRKTMSALESKSVNQKENANRFLTIERQNREILQLKKIISVQESDVVNLTMQRHEAVRKLRDEKDTHRRNRNQWKEEKAELEAKIAELTRTLRKLTPLKSRSTR
ncbi:hypothetical protein [Paraburkholderia caribensis]|uniref:hypothetical protein n=1 Tax=Paraburkholderia caribensis TaxID=75105 RepID=UPI000A74EAFE